MLNITYLMDKSNMDYFSIMKLPYAVFLSLLKQFRLLDLKSTPEGLKLLKQSERLRQSEPNWDRLRNSNIYKVQ